MLNEAKKLDRNLLIGLDDEGDLRYEQLEEGPYESRLNRGSAYEDEDGTPVLVIHPNLGSRLVLGADEAAAWRRDSDDLPLWDASEAYRWERAPGPWLEPYEDAEDVAVGSRLGQ